MVAPRKQKLVPGQLAQILLESHDRRDWHRAAGDVGARPAEYVESQGRAALWTVADCLAIVAARHCRQAGFSREAALSVAQVIMQHGDAVESEILAGRRFVVVTAHGCLPWLVEAEAARAIQDEAKELVPTVGATPVTRLLAAALHIGWIYDRIVEALDAAERAAAKHNAHTNN